MPGINEIAKELGLNVSTVSRALNNRYGVSHKTRKRVTDAADRFGLASRTTETRGRPPQRTRSRVIGMIVPDCASSFFGQLVSGAESLIVPPRSMLTVANSRYQITRERQLVEGMIEQGVDGLILFSISEAGAPYPQIDKCSIPLVMADHEFLSPSHPSVVWDDAAGARELASLMVGLNSRRFAVLVPANSLPTTIRRLEAFREALALRGIDRDSLDVYRYGDEDSGRSAILRLVHEHAVPPSIFLIDGGIANAVFKVLRDFGFEPGRDVLVGGFGHDQPGTEADELLTVVRQDMNLMGQKCIELLERQFDDPGADCGTIVLPPPLIVRGSCGAATRSDKT